VLTKGKEFNTFLSEPPLIKILQEYFGNVLRIIDTTMMGAFQCYTFKRKSVLHSYRSLQFFELTMLLFYKTNVISR